MSACGCKVMLQMNMSWMKTLVGKEGCNAVVALEYCYKWTQLMEEFRPMSCWSCIDLEVLFQIWLAHLVCPSPLGWSGSEVKLHVQCSSKGPKKWIQFHTMIRSDVAWALCLEICVEWRVVQVECIMVHESEWSDCFERQSTMTRIEV